MDVQKVLLEELAQQISRRNPQTALKLKEVEVIGLDVASLVETEERIVTVENIGRAGISGRHGGIGPLPINHHLLARHIS